MITFGGRPLNTYKGGMDWGRGVGDVQEQPVDQSTTEAIKSKTLSVATSEDQSKKQTADQSKTLPADADQSKKPPADALQSKTLPDMKPIIVKVKPELVKITGPGLFDPPTNKDKNTNQDPIQDLNPDDPFNPKNIDKMNKAIKDREFNSRLVVKLFGKEVVLTVEFLWWLCGLLWTLIIFTIIFSICYFLHQITQGVLDAYHTVVDGITKLMEDINNIAIKFEVPGINKKIGPFHISMPPLFKFDFKLFGGMFDGPLRDMYRASAFTRSATELIIQILIEMVIGIVEMLPAIGEGIMNAVEKIGDAAN